jgi:hypothetical protein
MIPPCQVSDRSFTFADQRRVSRALTKVSKGNGHGNSDSAPRCWSQIGCRPAGVGGSGSIDAQNSNDTGSVGCSEVIFELATHSKHDTEPNAADGKGSDDEWHAPSNTVGELGHDDDHDSSSDVWRRSHELSVGVGGSHCLDNRREVELCGVAHGGLAEGHPVDEPEAPVEKDGFQVGPPSVSRFRLALCKLAALLDEALEDQEADLFGLQPLASSLGGVNEEEEG